MISYYYNNFIIFIIFFHVIHIKGFILKPLYIPNIIIQSSKTSLNALSTQFDLTEYLSVVTPFIERQLSTSLNYQKVPQTDKITKVRLKNH